MTHPVSRRRLLTSGAAASFLAASASVAYAMPRRGGLLRLGVTGSLGDWDTRRGLDTFGMVAGIGTVFEGLTEIAADGSLRGELAEGWRASDGGSVWDFRLRQGVRFHDGSAFGPEDVLASVLLHRGTASPGAWIANQVQDITVVDAYALRVTLVAPTPDFPLHLADPHMVIYPAADIAGAMRNGIGTGLYRAGRIGPGDRLTCWRIADHWKGEAWGSFTEVELLSLPSVEDRSSAVSSGQVHAAEGDPVVQIESAATIGVPIWHGDVVGGPQTIGQHWPMDNARIAERWWRV